MIVIANNKLKEQVILDGNRMSKCKEVYEIGYYYTSDKSNGRKITNLTDVKWKIIKISKARNLLIISVSNVKKLILKSKDNLKKEKNDYIDGAKKHMKLLINLKTKNRNIWW